MTGALQALTEAYGGRAGAAAHWRAKGWCTDSRPAAGLVVGYVGGDVPVEMLTAAGALPIRLAGDPRVDTGPGDRYLGRGLDPVARSVLTLLLAGHYGDLDRIVVSRDCEASLRLFYAIRELRRVEPSLGLPEAYLVDILHLPHRTTTRYNSCRLRQFRDRLGDWVGRPLSDSDLACAIERHDAQRRLLREVAALRRCTPARLSGVEFLAAVGAGTAMPVTAHIDLLSQLLADADSLPARAGTRVFLTGSGHDTPEIYRALEGIGFVVVGEDHDWGDLLFERQVGPATQDALAERYQYSGPTAQRATVDARARYTALAARRCGAEVLVGYARRADEAPPWDFVAQAAATGLPAAFLERQPYGQIDLEALSGLRIVAGQEG